MIKIIFILFTGEKLQSLLRSIETDDCHRVTLDAVLTAAHRARIEITNSRPNKNGLGNTLGVDMNHLAYSKVSWSYKGATQRDEYGSDDLFALCLKF